MRSLEDWPKYRATFDSGKPREFIARNDREARDRAETYAGTRTVVKLENI